jgi:hypothetical protein
MAAGQVIPNGVARAVHSVHSENERMIRSGSSLAHFSHDDTNLSEGPGPWRLPFELDV